MQVTEKWNDPKVRVFFFLTSQCHWGSLVGARDKLIVFFFPLTRPHPQPSPSIFRLPIDNRQFPVPPDQLHQQDLDKVP